MYVVTMNDKVYAFEGTNCTLLLGPKSLLQGSEVAAQCADIGGGGWAPFKPPVGILGTHVIDTSTNIMYLISWAEIQSPQTFTHRIHALDITNFNEKSNSPVTVSATVGSVSFTSKDHIQRCSCCPASRPWSMLPSRRCRQESSRSADQEPHPSSRPTWPTATTR